MASTELTQLAGHWFERGAARLRRDPGKPLQACLVPNGRNAKCGMPGNPGKRIGLVLS